MTHSYLFQIIRSLDPEERKDVLLFVDSPFFNRSKPGTEATRLLRLLLTEHPDILEGDFDKEHIYSRLYPEIPFVEGKLEKTMAELNRMIRNFLTVRQYLSVQNEFHHTLDMAEILRKRGLESRYLNLIERLENMLSADVRKTTEHQFRQYLLEHEKYEWESLHNRKKGDLHIPQVVRCLDISYHTYRLELLNHFMLQMRATKTGDTDTSMHPFPEMPLPPEYLVDDHLLLITEKIHRLLRAEKPETGDFHVLTDTMEQYEDRIGTDTLQRYYTFLRSLCAYLINSGHEELLPVLHRINRKNLEKGYLYYEGMISPGTLANVTNVALMVGAFDWAADFIESQKDNIIGDNETRDFYRLNLAGCHFAAGNYTAALDLIPAASPDLEYHYRCRRLRLKVYYELDSDLLQYEMDAFKMLVSRASKKVLSPHFRELQSNFINLLFQIVHSAPGDPQRSERLIRRIREKKSVADKKWLLEKAEGLG